MPKRDAAHMDAQRERIVRATIECIGEKGIERTSIADICRKAELSAGALYVHFSNKDEIILAALRYGSMTAASLPDSWEGFKAMVSSLGDQMGFDITTVVRVRLHLHTESAHPGRLHDVYKPFLEEALGVLSAHLKRLAERGEIGLRMDPRRTALSISSFIDGILWNALATDRPLKETKAALAEGLEMFVTRPTSAR
jgi:AcrR family transcriptional regulator